MDTNGNKRSISTVALIHAPSEPGAAVQEVWDALLIEAAQRRIRLNQVFINPSYGDLSGLRSDKAPFQLILIWGLQSTSDMPDMVSRYCSGLSVSHLLALDSRKLTRHRLFPEQTELGDTLNLFVSPRRRLRIITFLAGFFYGQVPYGYRKVPVVETRPSWLTKSCGEGPYRLDLGDPVEIEIVQCMFDLLSNDGMTRTQILNTLVTQKVEPPHGSERWTSGRVTLVLSDPTYIGANRYCDLVCRDVFPPIISEQQFFKVQFLLSNKATNLRFHDIGSFEENLKEERWDQ